MKAPTPGATELIRRRPTIADREPVRHARRRRRLELALGFAFPALLLAFWQIAGSNGWISRFNYPPPSDIVDRFIDTRDAWWTSIRVTLARLLWGYLWGVAIGITLGVLMGMGWLVRATLEPTLNALYTVPKLALIGVFLIVLGFDNKPIIAVVGVTVFFFVWIQTQSAVQSVTPSYAEAARSFGSSRWQVFRHVILPASLPQIFVGLRVAGGVAVLTVIGAEFVFAPGSDGIGYRINNARTILDPQQAYVGLAVAGVLGVLFTLVIRVLDRLASPWARESRSID